MIGQTDIRDIKVINADARTVQDKINLPQGSMAWMRWFVGQVGVFQTCSGKKKIQFPAAPEGIEVAGNDHFLVGILDKVVQLFELILPMPVFERQVDDKNGDGLQVRLDNQLLNSLLKIVETKSFNALLSEQSI
jgi:hypothetical protein